jgi:hypothetical protein
VSGRARGSGHIGDHPILTGDPERAVVLAVLDKPVALDPPRDAPHLIVVTDDRPATPDVLHSGQVHPRMPP